MKLKKYILPIYMFTIALVSGAVLFSSLGLIPYFDIHQIIGTRVLGQAIIQVSPTPEKEQSIASPLVAEPQVQTISQNSSAVQQLPNISTGPSNAVAIQSATKETTEGEYMTFTWYVNGAPQEIKTTTIYFGKTSVPGTLETNVSPLSIGYSEWIKEFINGQYNIPLNFTASLVLGSSGTWYARPYAEIAGKHYWGEETSLTVLPKPKHEIRIVNPPSLVKKGEGVTFTWDIIGPSATTWYTVIVNGRQSRTGPLDESIGIPQTPYGEYLKHFANPQNAIHIPLQFIGTVPTTETGVFYYRALALINGKNIWSEEYSYQVTE